MRGDNSYSQNLFNTAVNEVAGEDYQKGCTAAYKSPVKNIAEKPSPSGHSKGNQRVPCQISQDMTKKEGRNPNDAIFNRV